MSLFLTNTLTRSLEPFIPISDPVRIYVCGMTVQDQPHLGHLRAYVFADVFRRYLEFSGYKVFVVQNFTDIDDKVIIRAQEENTDYRIIAERYIKEYFEVADKLNIKRASVYPRATQHIPEIIELTQSLVNKGLAYISDGDVYYDISKFSNYGKLSKKQIEGLIAGARIEPQEKKRSPLDFALWKASKENEPFFHSPWGKGRPGWHTECSAMAMLYLGETFDVHLGGEDLIFPHHENEIAQSEGLTGKPFANYWLHNGLLNLSGEKMAKSTRHFYSAKEVLEKYYPNVIRLYFLQSHYRSPVEFDFELLKACRESLTRIEEFLNDTEVTLEVKKPEEVSEEAISIYKNAMNNDLNTSEVIGMIFDKVKEGFVALTVKNKEEVLKKYSEIRFYLDNLGFLTEPKDRWLKYRSVETTLKLQTEVERFPLPTEFIKARDTARAKQEYEIADLIRQGLQEMGFILEDTPEGTRIKKKGD